MTGPEIGHTLRKARIPDVDSSNTKWKRLYNEFASQQKTAQTGIERIPKASTLGRAERRANRLREKLKERDQLQDGGGQSSSLRISTNLIHEVLEGYLRVNRLSELQSQKSVDLVPLVPGGGSVGLGRLGIGLDCDGVCLHSLVSLSPRS